MKKNETWVLSSYFQDDTFPEAVEQMTSLRWLRLNRTNLETIPYEISHLEKLVST